MNKDFASMVNSGCSVLTVPEVAQALNCEGNDVLALIESGQLKSVTVGGVVKVSEPVLASFLGIEDNTSVAKIVEQQQRAKERIAQAFYQSYIVTYINDLSLDISDNGEEAEEMAKLGYGQGSCYYSKVRKRYECQFPIVDGDKVKRKLVWGTTEAEAIGKMAVAKQLAAGLLVNPAPVNVMPVIMQPSAPAAPAAELVREKHLLSDVIDGYLKANKGSWKPSSYEKSKNYASRLKALFVGEYVEDITSERIETFCVDVADKGNGESYSKRYTGELSNMLKAVFKRAKNINKYISENPYIDEIKKPSGKKTNSRGRCLTEEEWAHLLRRVEGHPRYEPMLKLMYLTGMRIGETLALDWKNVDLVEQNIYIDQGVTIDENRKTTIGGTKSECSDRDIPLRDEAVELLKKWKKYLESDEALCRAMKANGMEGLVFPNSKGNLYDRNSFWDKLKLFVRRPKKGENGEILVEGISFPFTPHYLRHSFATNLSGAGVNIQDIRDLLGHADIAVTGNVYVGKGKKQSRKAVNALPVNW